MFGFDREELLGQHVEMLLPQSMRDAHRRERSQYADKPDARAMGSGRDLFATRKDGSEFPVEIALTPITEDGETSILCTIIDITGRKTAENLLRERKEELREAQRLGSLGFWRWSATTDKVMWSEEAYRIFGVDPATSISMPDYEALVHPDD